jgi:hypothetical protein
MKFSLISATSMLAMAASAHAYVASPEPRETNVYDLVHDSDGTAGPADRAAIAASALQATDVGQSQSSFTGPVDRAAAAGSGFPLVPLGAARSTPPDEDFATQYTGAWRWNAWQRALAIGIARVAPLIGTIGNGSSPDQKPGSTVFVANLGFSGGGSSNSKRRTAGAFAPSSTSTATITLTGPANIPQRAGSGFAIPASVSAESQPVASQPPPTDPAPTYRYAPQPAPGAKGNLVAASFANAFTASQPEAQANPHPSTALLPNSATVSIYAKRLDVTQPIDGQSIPTDNDGTRTFLPASVSANPAATAARYVTSVLDAATGNASGQSAEVFQIGPETPGGAVTSVAVPLRGKIMAGAGPLDNSLALP